MTWFKVSDDLHDHEKWEVLEEAGDMDRYGRAVTLWTFAGSYCSKMRNGGYITALRVTKLVPFDRDASRDAAEALCEAGFWEHADDGAYVFRNWEQYQPDPVVEEAGKQGSAARSKRYRENKKKRDSERDASRRASQVTVTRDAGTHPARPDPTIPDPSMCGTRDGESAIRVGFSARFERARGTTWAHARHHGGIVELAAWLRQNPAIDLAGMLDRFFADPWATANAHPFGALAKSPDKYAKPPKARADLDAEKSAAAREQIARIDAEIFGGAA